MIKNMENPIQDALCKLGFHSWSRLEHPGVEHSSQILREICKNCGKTHKINLLSKEIDFPSSARRILYCEDCQQFLLDTPKHIGCKLADHSILGKNNPQLYQIGGKLLFRSWKFVDRLVQDTSTKIVHALGINGVWCSVEYSNFSERFNLEVNLSEAHLCNRCRRKLKLTDEPERKA